MERSKLEKLKTMYALSGELIREQDKQTDGDLHIIYAILKDKLRFVEPHEFYQHSEKAQF